MNLLKVTPELWFFLFIYQFNYYIENIFFLHTVFFAIVNPNYFHPLFIQIYLTHEITSIWTAEEGDVFSVWETAIKELKIFFKIF